MLSSRITRGFACLAFIGFVACSNGGGTNPPAPGPRAFTMVAGGSMNMEAMQAIRFYPDALTVDVGDTVTWSFPSGEPHTVSLLGPNAALPPPTDPTAPAPAGSTTYDGTAYTSSGFKLLGASYSLTFTKVGTYMFQCLLHAGMSGTITVQPAGTLYPLSNGTAAEGAAAAQAADLALGTVAVAQFPFVAGGPHLAAGITPGLTAGPPSPMSVVRFLDGPTLASTSVTIAAGQTVTWTNESNNFPHTVTLAPVGAPFPAMPPFSPPSGGNVYTGLTLVNSGVLQPGASFALQFTTPGTYIYHCLYHDDTENMIGTVVVQ